MTHALRTRFNNELISRGYTLTQAFSQLQLREVLDIARSTGCEITKPADSVTAGVQDSFVLAAIASQTHTITVTAVPPGTGLATGIVTIAVADAAGDVLAVTNVAGVVAIALANTTDSKNTLTLIKAALDAASGGQYATKITGTATTQIVHGGTNDVAATAAGGAAAGALKSSVAGSIAANPSGFTVIPA